MFAAEIKYGKMASKNTVYGYAAGIISAMCYGLNPLFAVYMYRDGMSVDSVLMFRYAISAVIMLAMMLAMGENLRVRRREIAPLVTMGMLFVLSSMLLYESYNYMDVGVASTLLFVYPVLVALINAACFGERLSARMATALAVCCAGVALLCKSEDGAINLTGVVLVLLSSLSYAIYIIGVRHSAISDYSATKLTFYAVCVGTLFIVVKLGFLTRLDLPTSATPLACGVGLALFPTVISLILMAIAVKRVGSTPTAILGSLEPIVGVTIGVAAFGEILTARIVSGMAMIILAVLLVIVGKKRTSKVHA